MQLGMVGLGRMGASMTTRLLKGGHEVVVTDLVSEAIDRAAKGGATPAQNLVELTQKLAAPRIVWLMVPAGDAVDQAVHYLGELFEPGDVIIDGGNSNYKDSIRHGQQLLSKGIHFLDVGTSGGVWGLENGYSLMVGGEADIVTLVRPILETLAPAPDQGWGHIGSLGAGHYAKMIHNGIEYGLMQAYAEGFAIMQAKEEFAFDLANVADIWGHGSVIRSWLLDLIGDTLSRDANLDEVAAYVPDPGEGRWTVAESFDLNVSAPIITLSLQRRIRSREDEPYVDRLINVLRSQFSGHPVKKVH